MRRPQWLWPEYEGEPKRLIWKRVITGIWLRIRLFFMTPKQRVLFKSSLNERRLVELQRKYTPLYLTVIPRKKWEGEPYKFPARTSWKEDGR